MIHLKTTCDRRRTKKDGTNPIVFRLTVNGSMRDISTGLSCHANQWDYKKCLVKGKSDELILLGRRIKDTEHNLLEKIREFENKNPLVTNVQEIKDYLCNKQSKTYTVKEVWLEEIERMRRAQKHSNARNYVSALVGLELTTEMDIPFDKINFKWLLEVETSMRERGLKTTSISVYLRTLRSIYNRAINLDIIDLGLYPFRRYKIQNGTSTPRSLTLAEMRTFFHYQPTSQKLKYAHDIGRLIFMLRGMNFTDLALMTSNQIKNGRLVYERSKTHKMYTIKILPQVEELLDTYKSDVQNLRLNILSDLEYANKSKLPENIMQSRKVLNKWLRRIGIILGLREPISTYVFRYSHANICRELGYSKDLISQSLGHQNTDGAKVTDRYLHDYDMKLIDDMNAHVVREVK